MDFILIGISAVILLTLLVGLMALFSKRGGKEEDVVLPTSGDCTTCSGFDEACEQTCMMEAATKEIEYYDDEELDRYKGRDSDNYTDEEADEFAEILYTMQSKEAKGWNRSLILRGINVPNQVKDELIAMIEG
ncbi:hypothetical protein ETF27_02650 [Prevotella brunnea]|uniref:Phospholipase n=1 Tax=Prevotella brunnea TaxID=2508867 RepID=A0A5C8GLC3_9BACT|nr:hypothetical protein [Prevotella brunnea]MDR0186220.1 hypothetical protein [Prevotella brunnea]TXJ62891.1 hypothetical protein ETF27_02650 [Prevotella brunnea]